jgi:uncharacterized protein YqjF (DUF2071 family)
MKWEVAHRPWPLPARLWVMQQRWHDLLFAHWPIAADVLRTALPPALELDTFDGQGWIGVVPFRMGGVRPRCLPSLPWLSAFPELNVRTYVKVGDKAGVYFFSLDAGNPLAVAAARRWYHLPYFQAAMRLQHASDGIRYHSQRTHRGAPGATFQGSYGPTSDIYLAQAGTLEHWLTERYALYTTDQHGRVCRGDIHHQPWPLQAAEAEIVINTMTRPPGIELPETRPLLHFARRIDVVVWLLKRLG